MRNQAKYFYSNHLYLKIKNLQKPLIWTQHQSNKTP